MRFVLDTATMVAAIRSDRGASRRLLMAVFEQRLTMLVSVPLMLEYEAVMTRAIHLTASGLTVVEANHLLDNVAATAEAVYPSFLWRPAVADPDDDMVLETAVNGGADAVVTFNLRDMQVALAGFGIAAIRPGEALRWIEATP